MTKYCNNTCRIFNKVKNFSLANLKKLKNLFWVFLGLVTLVSIGVYLVQINTIAAKGFEVRDLERQINELRVENEKLSIKAVELRSSVALMEKIEELDMHPVEGLSYLNPASDVVAQK